MVLATAYLLSSCADGTDPLPTIPANQWKPGSQEMTDGQLDLVSDRASEHALHGDPVPDGLPGWTALRAGEAIAEPIGLGEPGNWGAATVPLAAAPGVVRLPGTTDKLALFDAAGVPEEWRADLDAIIECESHWNPGAIGDSGNSLGLAQLWFGWAAREGQNLLDPVTNLRVAVRVRELRGRFGGGGGWSCADILGIK